MFGVYKQHLMQKKCEQVVFWIPFQTCGLQPWSVYNFCWQEREYLEEEPLHWKLWHTGATQAEMQRHWMSDSKYLYGSTWILLPIEIPSKLGYCVSSVSYVSVGNNFWDS